MVRRRDTLTTKTTKTTKGSDFQNGPCGVGPNCRDMSVPVSSPYLELSRPYQDRIPKIKRARQCDALARSVSTRMRGNEHSCWSAGGRRHQAIAPGKVGRYRRDSTADPTKEKSPNNLLLLLGQKPGNVLLSREFPVSSAPRGLTTVFGMGTGVTPSTLPPG